MKTTLSFLLALLLLGSCKSNQPIQNSASEDKENLWTKDDQEAYAHRNNDSTKWDMESLRQDLDTRKKHPLPTKPAISDYPSPVAKYDWGAASSLPLSLEMGNKHIIGSAIGYAKDKYNKHLFTNEEDFFLINFNILILTDLPQKEMRSLHVVSRNYPHYLSTGKQKTSLGELDWVQMTLASNESFAIINQRYFDLAYGKTLLVAPQKDGSLRILQLQDSPHTITGTGEVLKKKMDSFIQGLQSREDVIHFFSNTNTLD